jgi:thioredoxin-like negative regulator of GroEL
VLLAFSTPGCADCRYRQEPAIEQVRAALGAAVETRHVDAAREPDLAAHFGILTAPSTVVIAPSGRVVARNDGFAPVEALLGQLRPLLPESGAAN